LSTEFRQIAGKFQTNSAFLTTTSSREKWQQVIATTSVGLPEIATSSKADVMSFPGVGHCHNCFDTFIEFAVVKNLTFAFESSILSHGFRDKSIFGLAGMLLLRLSVVNAVAWHAIFEPAVIE